MTSLEERYTRHRQRLERYGQAHLLAYWERLDAERRRILLDDLDEVDWDLCSRLIGSHVLQRPGLPLPGRIEPARAWPAEPDAAHAEMYRQAELVGLEAIRAGQVAALTVAGGQGTRLGYDGPKGAFPISPVRGASLFELFAEAMRGAGRRYGHLPRWYILTSPLNHQATIEFFHSRGCFGIPADEIVFFRQGQMPAFLTDGRIALSQPHRLALGPNGHGGSLRALRDSGALADMRSRGIEYISYFQVDNPLVKPIDPLFIGLHILHRSEMSSKAVAKVDDLERVGNFCLADGKLTVIEYSDLPDELAHARNADGSRRFDAGSIAIHVLSRSFVEHLTAPDSSLALPWHRADKKMPVLDPDRRNPEPTAREVVKLELFVFDAIPLASNPLVLYTRRDEEFSPVKNATGVDSAHTARRDLTRRAARWLESCGCRIPRDAAGEPAAPMEISPAFAVDAADLRERLTELPEVAAGRPLVLA